MPKKIQGWRVADKRGQKSSRIIPFAPSKNEIKFYHKYLKLAAKNSELPRRVLILGATPEPRDISIELGLEAHAVDISREMMEKFSALMDYQRHPLDKRKIQK